MSQDRKPVGAHQEGGERGAPANFFVGSFGWDEVKGQPERDPTATAT